MSNLFPSMLSGLSELQLNPFTLAFRGTNETLEEEFGSFYFKEKLLQMRAGIIVGLALYCLFGILDAYFLTDLKYTFWFIRFGIITPVALISFLATFSNTFNKTNQWILTIVNLFAGTGIIAMVVLAGPPVSYSYYAGLILVFIFVNTISGLRFIWAFATSWALVIIFEIVAIYYKEFPMAVFVSNSSFFVASNVLTIFAAYFIEFSLRRDFYLARLLEIEKEKVNHSKRNLERMVQERTQQLSESNKKLNEELDQKRKLITKQERLQEQLIQAQKMEAIGLLAGGIAHDFNNLLTVINGYSELLLLKFPETDASFERLQQIQEAGKRAERLTRQLLAFSRKQLLQPVELDLNQLLRELEKMLHRLIGEHIELKFKYGPDLHKIKADPGQLEQVILNLVVNARDAMPRGGTISIETLNMEINEQKLKNWPGLTTGEKVLLTITDTGVGMDDTIKAHIFDPFFTTKETGKGTGLGLSTVYGIIKQSKGFIYVDSQLGQGTSFSVFFTAVREGKTDIPEQKSDHRNFYGKETILVAEDEDAVRNYIHVILKKYGYTVLLTSNGQEAIHLLNQNSGDINLLITDIIMPGMSGKELVDQVLKIKRDLPYLYISGYTDDIIGQQGILDKKIKILQKPFTYDTLLEKIRTILDQKEEELSMESGQDDV